MPLFLYALLRTTPVQSYITKRVADFLSSGTGARIEVGGVDISWFLKLRLNNLKILDKHGSAMIEVKRIGVKVNNLSLKSRQLSVKQISLEQADINLIHYLNDSSLNLQVILDYFASTDTTPSSSPPWQLKIQSVSIKNSHFAYRDERYLRPGKGIDYSDLDLSNLNLALEDIHFSGDSVLAEIKNLSAKEKSGFRIRKLSASAIVSPEGFSTKNLIVKTDKSDLALDLKMIYNDWSAFNDFLDSVTIVSTLRKSTLDMRDIVYFAPEIDGMDEVFSLEGYLKGKVSSFSGRHMDISFGQQTHFRGNIRMSGLPDIKETFVILSLSEFRSNATDLNTFTLPYSSGQQTLSLPEEVQRLGNITISGKFTGFYNDFASKSTFITDAGTLNTDITLNSNEQTKAIEYKGHINALNIDIRKILQIEQLGLVSIDANVDGQGFSATGADLTMNGLVTNFQLMGNTLDRIRIDGSFRNRKFEGLVALSDRLAKLDFNGSVDFSDSIPAFDCKADLRNAWLTRLHLWDRDSSSLLSTHMDLNFKGNTLDNLLGALKFTNTSYQESGKSLEMKKFILQTTQMAGAGKDMTLTSDFANASFNGQYTFDDLAEYLTFVFRDYLPGLALVSPVNQRESKGKFEYAIHLINTRPITSIFLSDLSIDPNTVISGSFDPAIGLIDVHGESRMIRYQNFSMQDWSLNGRSHDNELGMAMNCRSLDLTAESKENQPRLEQFRLESIARNDSVFFKVKWNDLDSIDRNRADLGGAISFHAYPLLAFQFSPSSLLINDTAWNIQPGNLITLDSSLLAISNLGFISNRQSIFINGLVSHDPLDHLEIEFRDFDISQFDMLTEDSGIDFDGKLNGKLNIADIYNVPLVNTSLLLKSMGFNREKLGDAEIISSWDNRMKAAEVNVRIAYHGTAGLHYPVLVKGFIYPEQKKNNLDLDIDIDNVKIKVLVPFFTGLFSRMKGWGSGKMKLSGDFADPVLTGSIQLMRSEFLVDYLRTTYSFTGAVNFDRGLIWFKDLNLADSVGNTGTATGNIRHRAFKDWSLDVNVNSRDLYVLNTSYNPDEMYFGKARVNGNMSLTGPVNDLKLVANATSGKGTDVHIPLDYAVDISENDYIYYVARDTAGKVHTDNQVVQSNMNIRLNLDVTDDAMIEIILPYRMGNIKARGNGLLNLGVDTRGNYSMNGQYIMEKGSFQFNLQGLFSRNFEIRKGGTITFNGSPDDADIDLQAVYKIKTTLAGLGSIPPEQASRRIPVDCIVSLRNDLYNPDIRFSIAMPEADAETQRMVYGAIDTANAVVMNQQMISLLVLNSFTSPGESSGLNAAGLGISSFGIINGQLNNWLSQISKDFDIGVNYRPGDQMTAEELELALSTQLFNDRVVIDGAFGRSAMNSAAAGQSGAQTANQWIGDVNVEVKITEDGRFRVKAFNRTNTSLDLYTGQSPYTQGVGILYRKDFDHIGELFHKQKDSIIKK
jgi:hypothetical protein